MGAKSRTKGAAAEREVAELARQVGFDKAIRAAPMQCAGYADDYADVTGVGRFHIEVKRRGKGSLYGLAVDNLGERAGYVPLVAYREDRGPWLGVLRLEDALKLEREHAELVDENAKLRTQLRDLADALHGTEAA